MGRNLHHRTRDHTGTQPATAVVLASDIGSYPAGMTVEAVLAAMITRIAALEGGAIATKSFSLAAFVQPYFRLSAIIAEPGSGSFDLSAWVAGGGSFGASAIVLGTRTGSLGLSAFIV
jgi:hypothetical protein